MTDRHTPRHCVAVIGGATAGAEIARRLAEHGCYVAVFEKNARPYGKIEDGLPRWHRALREKEFSAIDSKLHHPHIDFVPLTQVGRDLSFEALAQHWGFQLVVLACGAWRDRPLPLARADELTGHGLVYQNDLIHWFNHYPEADYQGPHFAIVDGAIIIGGGLASIDVAKVCMLETTMQALAQRDIPCDMEALERAGIDKFLAGVGVRWEDLGLRGCTVFYRRRMEDMPLVEMPAGADSDKAQRVEQSRRRIAEKAMEKYRFAIVPQHSPKELLEQNGQVVGMRFNDSRGSFVTFESTLVVSSIGSIPAPIPGVPMEGELFAFEDQELGRLRNCPNVYGVGNVVTGRGNIVVSRRHAISVSEHIIAAYLGVHEGPATNLELAGQATQEKAVGLAQQLQNATENLPIQSAATVQQVRQKVAQQREKSV